MAATPGLAIDVLILDINDVLYRYDVPRRIELLARATGTAPAAVHEALYEAGVEARSDAGELLPDEYLRALSEGLGQRVDRAIWTAALAGATTPMPDAIHVIRTIRPQIDTVGLSNNGIIVKEQAPAIYPVLRELDIELFVTAEFGAPKPDACAYLGLCDRLRVAPDRAAFVDDKPANAHGATDAGLIAHRFTDADALRRFLRALGLDC